MSTMTVNDYLRLIAGTAVLVSVALGATVSPVFYAFTAFVGANLFQSALTKRCPMMWLLHKLGVPESPPAPGSEARGQGRSRNGAWR